MEPIALGIQAETLTPFAYHSLMVQSGTATLPELIGDRAIAFALASTLGMLAARVALPKKAYRQHLGAMPWRTSPLITSEPQLLAPLIKRLNLDAEAGLKMKVQDVAKKGNLKDFFKIQEVPPGVLFKGALFGFDPFQLTGQDQLVLRIGLHRNGMIRLRAAKDVDQLRLNASTAALFGRELPVERYLLHSLQLTPLMTLDDAMNEVAQWQ